MVNDNISIDEIKRKSNIFGIVCFVLAIIGFVSVIGGETPVKYLSNIISICTLIAGLIFTSNKNQNDLSKIGNKLVWGGWLLLPLNLGGFLLNLSPYYSAGLNQGLWIALLLSRLGAACFGLYIIFYSNKKTGAQIAP